MPNFFNNPSTQKGMIDFINLPSDSAKSIFCEIVNTTNERAFPIPSNEISAVLAHSPLQPSKDKSINI